MNVWLKCLPMCFYFCWHKELLRCAREIRRKTREKDWSLQGDCDHYSNAPFVVPLTELIHPIAEGTVWVY